MTKRKPVEPGTTEVDLRCPVCGTVHHTLLAKRNGEHTVVCCNCKKPFVIDVKVKEAESTQRD